ncbi:MAG: hypothetical protein GY905_14440, partial [Gammaproteobacteria bacterium]|nr:hypothetical protein [Gammaproteobacteria bacterium]
MANNLALDNVVIGAQLKITAIEESFGTNELRLLIEIVEPQTGEFVPADILILEAGQYENLGENIPSDQVVNLVGTGGRSPDSHIVSVPIAGDSSVSPAPEIDIVVVNLEDSLLLKSTFSLLITDKGIMDLQVNEPENQIEDVLSNIEHIQQAVLPEHVIRLAGFLNESSANTASDAVTVTITDAIETVSLSLSDTANSSVAENVAYSAAAPTLTGTPIGDVTYSLSGDDASLFSVATDGAVSMVGRDFENPADSGTNNTYSYTLVATDDDGNTASDGVTVTVTDATLAMSDTANSSVAENVAYSAAAPTITGAPMGTVTYSLAGADMNLFSVAADGSVSMAGQDFENPADTGTDNVYHYTLIAQDEEVNTVYDQVYVTVTNAIEGDSTAPTVSSFSSSTTNGSYNAGDRINITATTSESIQSGNTITVTMDTGDTVVLTAASAGTTLTGTYTVGAGDNSSDLTVSSFVIGTVADTAGNAMTSTTVPSNNNIADTSAIVIDTTAPTLSSSSPADNATAVAVGSNIVLNFSEAVDVESGNIVIY